MDKVPVPLPVYFGLSACCRDLQAGNENTHTLPFSCGAVVVPAACTASSHLNASKVCSFRKRVRNNISSPLLVPHLRAAVASL